MTPELHPALMRVIDEKEEGPVVLGEIARRHILPVARVIREAERVFVEHANEAGGPAAMLGVGLPIGARRGEEGRVDRAEESDEVRRDRGPKPPRASMRA